uniref:Adducin 2 n=1 Tax=Calidris pygmaea TaxID=425635 RepID=A0A8C3PQS2_9CHAR
MSTAASPEPLPSPPAPGPRYLERLAEEDPEFLRARNMAADLRQDFNMMEQKKRVTMILQSPSFREELESLIQEQMKKGNNSSHIWALRQIADFMATTSPAVLPTSPMGMAMPARGFFGGRMEQFSEILEGFVLICGVVGENISQGSIFLSFLIKVNVLGAVVEQGSTSFAPDARSFSLHAAIYAARPDARCIVRLHTPATAAVSAMRCGVLPISRAALLLGDVAYFDFRGEVEDEADRVELQKSLGPTCKILVLRNHGVLALGDTAEEAFYSIFHLQAACEIQVSALASAGGTENLIVLERTKHRPHEVGSVRWAGSTFGPMQKSRLGEHEFEALMRMLDNLGYRTGYTYRYPFVQEKSKPKSDVLIPATVTAFIFEEDAAPVPALRQHAQKQQKEKTRWLNTPNTYMRVNVAEEQQGSAGSQKTKTTWLKADEVEKGSSGTPIRIENPNQFVPLYTDPQEVLEMRNKIREQNRQDVKSAGPQSQLLASLRGGVGVGIKPPAAPTLTSLLSPYQGDKKADGGQAPADSAAEKELPAVVNGKDEEQSTEENLGKVGERTTSPANADPDAPKEKETVTSNPISPEGSPSKSPSKKKKKFRTPSFLKKGKKKEKIES